MKKPHSSCSRRAILRHIPTEVQIHKLLKQIVFGKKVACPRCSKTYPVVRCGTRWRCRQCRYTFSVTAACWLKGLKLPLETWYLILWCWLKKVPVLQTSELTRCSIPTIRRWYARFRTHLPLQDARLLSGIVQMDEAFFGGKKGHALVAAKERGVRRAAARVVSTVAVNRSHVTEFLHQHVAPFSQLWTDGGGIYKGIERVWPVQHSRDIHRKFEFAHTSEIEGFFGVFRTFVRRMYHHVTLPELPPLVHEYLCRFNEPELFHHPTSYLKKCLKTLEKSEVVFPKSKATKNPYPIMLFPTRSVSFAL